MKMRHKYTSRLALFCGLRCSRKALRVDGDVMTDLSIIFSMQTSDNQSKLFYLNITTQFSCCLYTPFAVTKLINIHWSSFYWTENASTVLNCSQRYDGRNFF